MKILKISLAVIALLLITAIALPFVFKGKIVALINEEVNKNVNAKVKFSDDIGFSIFSSFPDFTLSMKDIEVVGIENFEGDTLLALKNIEVSLDFMSVVNGEKIRIRNVFLNEPRIHAIILKNGKPNWDLAKPSGDTAAQVTTSEPTKFDLVMKKFEIKNAYISYIDKAGNMSSEIVGMNYILNGDFTQDLFTMNNDLDIAKLSLSMANISYLNNVHASVKAEIDANQKDSKYTFKNNEFGLNDLLFKMEGNVEMKGSDIGMDIKYAAVKNDFKDFLSLIPAIYSSSFKDLESKGKLGFDGFVKGIYNEKQLPAFAFNLMVENGWFKYPALPAPVENVGIDFHVTNADGNLDNTKINMSKLHFELQGDPFDAKLLAENLLKDPFVDAQLKGKLNLDNIVKIAPIPEGTKLSGMLVSDFAAKGKMSDIENKNYENFNASGNISVSGIQYQSKELPQGMNVKSATMSFNPQLVTLSNFDAKIGNSDMQMNGSLANFFPYFFGKGTLVGNLNFKSNLMDANQFLSKDTVAAKTTEAAAADTNGMAIVELPSNIDFTLTSNIQKLLYTNMDITNFNGTVKVANSKLLFNKVALNLLGSSMSMDGFYETTNPKKPTVDMIFGIKNLDIQKAFNTFNTIKKIAPIAEKMKGNFSTSVFKFTTVLDSKMMPVYESLYAAGDLQISDATVTNIDAFNKVADAFKRDEWKKVDFKNVLVKYEVKGGRIYTKPFNVKVGGQNLTLSGSTGLDQTINYTGTVALPRKDLGAANSAVEGVLAQLNQKGGTNIKMNEIINIGLVMGGTFTKPTVSTNLADIAKNEASSLKNQLTDEVNRKKKELEDQAKAEIEKQKKELEAKGRAEADRIKKEAEAKVKAEADKAKNRLEEEAKKKLKGLFGK
ncbi:MAG: AsmA-like C-terminal region-containing protein [Bacteroidia bacterium]